MEATCSTAQLSKPAASSQPELLLQGMVSAAETANEAVGICQGPFAARMRHSLGEVSAEMLIHVVVASAVSRMQFMCLFPRLRQR